MIEDPNNARQAFPARIICPQCAEQGVRSVVTEGATTVTLMNATRLYDANGHMHTCDPNVTTTRYHCTNGHTFTRSSRWS